MKNVKISAAVKIFGDESGDEEGDYLDDLDLPEIKIGKKSWQSCR
jgi:hypothetical protein